MISFSLAHIIITDYSDGNRNVSGAESEDEGESEKDKANISKDNEITTQTYHEHHNEIEESTTQTTSQSTLNLTLPCDSDRGGCDHECQMVKYYYDPEPLIQCSCYNGFTLDENDGRRCHGELSFSLNHFRNNLESFQQTLMNVQETMVVNKSATIYWDPLNVRVTPDSKSTQQTTINVSVSCRFSSLKSCSHYLHNNNK